MAANCICDCAIAQDCSIDGFANCVRAELCHIYIIVAFNVRDQLRHMSQTVAFIALLCGPLTTHGVPQSVGSFSLCIAISDLEPFAMLA